MKVQLLYTHFPYCVQHLDGDRYIILNRHYKPLGTTTMAYVDYDSHPSVVHMKITKKQAEKLSYNGKIESDSIYLFDNTDVLLRSPKALNEYMDKLKILSKLIYIQFF